MKKIKYLAMAALICASTLFCSCGTTKIEGRPSAVVDQAQDLKNGEKATVEVTGFVSETIGAFIYLTDSEDEFFTRTDYVQCSFESGSTPSDIEVGDRVTISGELSAEDLYIKSDSIWLHKCEVK